MILKEFDGTSVTDPVHFSFTSKLLFLHLLVACTQLYTVLCRLVRLSINIFFRFGTFWVFQGKVVSRDKSVNFRRKITMLEISGKPNTISSRYYLRNKKVSICNISSIIDIKMNTNQLRLAFW